MKPTPQDRLTPVQGKHFRWKLYIRKGVYYADGRGNHGHPLGRHSLGAKDYATALNNLEQLDHIKAVERGLAVDLRPPTTPRLPLAEGARQYREYVRRPAVAKGSESGAQRYRAVMDKLLPFLEQRGVTDWHHVDQRQVTAYLAHLEDSGYAYATQYLEGTVIKQAIKALKEVMGHRDLTPITLKLEKPDASTAYCYTTEEVRAVLAELRKHPELIWLYRIVFALVHTGLRIGELAAMRWEDVDFEAGVITVPDHSRQGNRAQRERGRSNKGRRSREFPLHHDLRKLLESIPRSKDGRVFHGPRGGQVKADVARRNLIDHAINPLAPKFPGAGEGKSFKDGRLHSFRHYFCSVCADNGTAEQQLMAWLGHRDSKMVKRYYHPDRQRSAQQMNKIDFLGGDASAA